MNNKKECGKEMEVYSRVVGYYRPVQNWNKGKREEFFMRKTFNVNQYSSAEKKENETTEEKSVFSV